MIAVLVAASAPVPVGARVVTPAFGCAASGTGSEVDYEPGHLGKASTSETAHDVAFGANAPPLNPALR
jgi:hypothetical protein